MAATLQLDNQPRPSKSKGRRIILLPLPLQGHISPMLQLASILDSRGFQITILHTQINSPNPSNYPHFTFLQIPVDPKHSVVSDINNAILLVNNLNIVCVEPIRNCLVKLVAQGKQDGEPVACLITDGHWHSTQAVADEIELPRIVLKPDSFASFRVFNALPFLREKGYFHLTNEDSRSDDLVPELPPLKVKDIPKIVTSNPEALCGLMEKSIKGTKAARGIIWNSFKELDEPSLATLSRDFPFPHFPIGPFHTYFTATSSSLLTQDQTTIPWLDKQTAKSVVYVSFGSIAGMDKRRFEELAWGLASSKQPFLWVVRPGLVQGSEWLEALPEGFLDRVGDRGRIVKWAPQQEILAHPATGVFWTHGGWNSTMESLCEGVPMICSPFFGDQPTNARYITDVWRVGLQLENGLRY